MWLRKCGQALRVFVPEGLDDRSQAIYCLERATQRTRPVGSGMIGSTGRFFDHGRRICRVAQLTPSLRDGSPFLGVFQAINCTIIQSLRDNKPPSQLSTKATPPYYIVQRAILLTVGNSAG